jgi:hypothetical protein
LSLSAKSPRVKTFTTRGASSSSSLPSKKVATTGGVEASRLKRKTPGVGEGSARTPRAKRASMSC